MPADSYPWTFTQLWSPTPGVAQKVLKLEGPNAPFGRPRKGAVAELEIELRETETHYPGNDVPDHHIFGSKHAPLELNGRWMDSRIGTIGGARAKAKEVKAFVDDKVPLYGEWGGILGFQGLIVRLTLGFEDDAEVVWKMRIKVDKDDLMPVKSPPTVRTSMTNLVKQVTARFANVNTRLVQIPPEITYQPNFLDRLHALISTANQASATVATFADSVDNFESALSADVATFRAGCNQYRTAVERMQITLGTAENDPAVQAATATAQSVYAALQAQNTDDLLAILAALATADLTAEILQKGTSGQTYTARQGDTWESIANVFLGDAAKADTLRQANAVRRGAQPSTGQTVHIPSSA